MTTQTVALAGDWHGDTGWGTRAIGTLADLGVRELFHLGDFGIWGGPAGGRYLRGLEAALTEHDMTLFVTPGNHENYDLLEDLPATDHGHGIGAVQWVSDHIAALPRAHRWQRNGWSFVSLGGAPSIDYEHRVLGYSWWTQEMILPEDVERTIGGGQADIMLAHDAPDAPYGTEQVALMLLHNPMGWSADALAYATIGRERMTEAFVGVKPRLFAHGHYHLVDDTTRSLDGWDHPVRVLSTGCEGSVRGNLVLLHLPVRDTAGAAVGSRMGGGATTARASVLKAERRTTPTVRHPIGV